MEFAEMFAYIVSITGYRFGSGEVSYIDQLITEGNPPNRTLSHNIDALLAAMQSNKKIEAIKEYRALTGAGMKESKDAVEKYWLTNPTLQA